MPRIDRIVKRAVMKAQLKQLRRAVAALEQHAVKEYARGFEAGGQAMKQIVLAAAKESP